MANLKFSGFTANAAVDQADSFLVGFDTDGGGANPTNNKWTFPQIAAGLAAVTATPFSIYAANGTIGTTRKALITDTIQFRNAGDTSDIFTLNTDGKFALGLGAAVTSNTSIAIGNGTTVTPATSVGIGSSPITNGMWTGATAVGISSGVSGAQSVAVGAYAVAPGGGIALGQGAGQKTGAYSMNIGYGARGEGANSITFNSSGATLAEPTAAKAFGVYMSSNTTPDFEVVGGGESTLNTPKFKITGQAYTELHTNATNLVVDWDDGNVQTVTISSTSPQFIPTRAAAGATYILMITQGATPTTIDWDGTVKWSGGAPTLSSTTGQIDVITLICYNATANAGAGAYYGAASLNLVI